MFFNKPKISRTWKSDSGTGYSIEDDAGRKVVLWFDAGTEDFIKDRAGGGDLRIVPEFEPLAQLAARQAAKVAAQRQQAQAGGGSGLGFLGGLGSLFGR